MTDQTTVRRPLSAPQLPPLGTLPPLPARTWVWSFSSTAPQALLDTGVALGCWLAAGWLFRPAGQALGMAPLVTLGLGVPTLFGLVGLYHLPVLNPVRELRKLTLGMLVMMTIAAASLVFQEGVVPEGVVLQALLALAVAVPLGAWLRTGLRRLLARAPGWGARALVVGPHDSCTAVFHAIEGAPQAGLRPVARVNSFPDREELAALASQEASAWALVAAQGLNPQELSQLIARYEGILPYVAFMGDTTVDVGETWDRRLQLGSMAGLVVGSPSLTPLAAMSRRALSLGVVLPALLLGAPVFLALALAVKLSSRGPIFYGQERIGRGGRRFHAWKFRTMVPDADAILQDVLSKDPEARAEWERDHKLRNDPRITGVGKFLRVTSLDELPQLWNVVVGQMNVVGPRPIVTDEISKYGNAFPLYQRVTPGVTGLWQVSGRNETSYEKRVKLDAFYVRNWSPWLDLYVLLRTVPVILRRQGAM